jgi:hypothetical protein
VQSHVQVPLDGPLFLEHGEVAVGGVHAQLWAEFDIGQFMVTNHAIGEKIADRIAVAARLLKGQAGAELLNGVKLDTVRRIKEGEKRLIFIANLLGIDLSHVRPPSSGTMPFERAVTWAERFDQHFRHKRQILELIGFAANLGLSIYTEGQVLSLKEELEKKTSWLSAKMDEQQNVLFRLSRNVDQVHNATLILGAAVNDLSFAQKVVLDISYHLDIHERELMDFEAATVALTRNSLSAHLISPTAMKSALQRLEAAAKAKNFFIVHQNPYQFKLSYIAVGTKLTVLIHVPTFNEKYDLFKY